MKNVAPLSKTQQIRGSTGVKNVEMNIIKNGVLTGAVFIQEKQDDHRRVSRKGVDGVAPPDGLSDEGPILYR